MTRPTLPAAAGIAVAPILFVIAIIGVIIAALSAGGNSLGGAAIREDRVIADLGGQIDLIRAKIDECVMLTRQQPTYANPNPVQYTYPGNTQLDTPIAVSALNCPGDPAGRQNLWTGARPSALPAPPSGFAAWQYVNHGNPDDGVSPGGICIRIQALAAQAGDTMLQAAVAAVLKRYSAGEYTFTNTGQPLVFWIKRPVSGTAC